MKRLTIASAVLSLGLFVGCASKQKTEPSTTPDKAAAAQKELTKETSPAPAAETPAAASETASAPATEAAPVAAPEPVAPPPPPPAKKVKRK